MGHILAATEPYQAQTFQSNRRQFIFNFSTPNDMELAEPGGRSRKKGKERKLALCCWGTANQGKVHPASQKELTGCKEEEERPE